MCDDAFDCARVPADHQVHVLGEYGAGVHGVVVFLKYLCEPSGHRACLISVEDYGRVFELLLSNPSKGAIVRVVSDGLLCLHFDCCSEPLQMRRCDTIGSRAARVVGEPEAVGREDDVEGSDHDRGL